MGKTIVFANQKGGVGKTTTTVNLGAYMAEAGKKVLLIDFDPQGNLSSSLGCRAENNSIYEALTGQIPVDEVIVKTLINRLDIITSDINLSGASVELINVEGRDYFLKKIIAQVKDRYDYILIDCPPSLGVLTINGFAAADYVIVPLQCEFFSLEGFLTMLFKTIRRIQQTVNPELKIAGIVFTMYDTRTKLSNEVIQKIKSSFQAYPDILFKTIIPRNVKLSEAPSHGQPINLYDRACIGARSYEKLSVEVIDRVR
jgi:chromosome partitioning protein